MLLSRGSIAKQLAHLERSQVRRFKIHGAGENVLSFVSLFDKVCAMNRVLHILLFLSLAFSASAGDVLVVKADSLENGAEQNYTESIIRGLGRLLDDLGIDWDTAPDDEATEGLRGRYPVVVLPHNPTLSAKTLGAVRG